MKYSVVQCVNGNFSIVSEHGDSQSAVVAFHDRCKNLWNAPDVITGMVKVFDESLNQYGNKVEYITHPVPEPEPEPEEDEEEPTE